MALSGRTVDRLDPVMDECDCHGHKALCTTWRIMTRNGLGMGVSIDGTVLLCEEGLEEALQASHAKADQLAREEAKAGGS